MYIKVYSKHTLIKSRDQPPLVLDHAVFNKIVLSTQQYYITCTVLLVWFLLFIPVLSFSLPFACRRSECQWRSSVRGRRTRLGEYRKSRFKTLKKQVCQVVTVTDSVVVLYIYMYMCTCNLKPVRIIYQ